MHRRDMTLTVEAGSALLHVLGILHDNDASPDAERTLSLEDRLHQAWSTDQMRSLEGPEAIVPLDIEDAAAILHGLAFTEMMSVHFPWFEMVQWTVEFVTAQIRPLWTEQEWSDYAGR